MYSFKRETSNMGTLAESPSTLSFRSGMTRPTAFAAPVELGTMFPTADLYNTKLRYCNDLKSIYSFVGKKYLFV